MWCLEGRGHAIGGCAVPFSGVATFIYTLERRVAATGFSLTHTLRKGLPQRDALAAAGRSRDEASTSSCYHTSAASATPVHAVRRPTHPRAPAVDGALPHAGGGTARRPGAVHNLRRHGGGPG